MLPTRHFRARSVTHYPHANTKSEQHSVFDEACTCYVVAALIVQHREDSPDNVKLFTVSLRKKAVRHLVKKCCDGYHADGIYCDIGMYNMQVTDSLDSRCRQTVSPRQPIYIIWLKIYRQFACDGVSGQTNNAMHFVLSQVSPHDMF